MTASTRLLAINPNGMLAMAGARLLVLRGPERRKALRLEREEVVVGSAPSSDLVLTDPTVSRSHFAVRAVEDGYLLVDLESTNGTFVDGRRIKIAYVQPGDVIDAGHSRIRFEATREQVELALSRSEGFGKLVGRSVAAKRLFALLDTVAHDDATVLLTGETGVGKDAAAEAIHEAGSRAQGPFVIVDCGSIAPSLIESELFGHERGAFTGADAERIGAFEEANGGTLFLDEIGELPRDAQAKIGRALDRREIRRVGGSATQKVDVRIIAATNRDLRLDVNRGQFREDLFYRLNVISIRVPPLRERPDDIPLLVEHFHRRLLGETASSFDPEVLATFMTHSWPGNVRELANRVELLVRAPQLHEAMGTAHARDAREESFKDAKTRAVDAFERGFLSALMVRANGNVSEAARLSGTDRVYLTRLLRKHGVQRPAPTTRR